MATPLQHGGSGKVWQAVDDYPKRLAAGVCLDH
jgi:hypothetical protein